jgi:hypothetical protein
MPEAKISPSTEKNIGCILAVFVGIGLLIWIASSGNSGSSSAGNSSYAPANVKLEAADAAVATSPLRVDLGAARHGTAQFKMVAAEHVPGSSEIFSRNCYEALGKPFNWRQLDRCGGYDALAVRWTAMNESVAGDDDLTYFQSETAATRYTRAALDGGLQVDEANERWSTIQGVAAKSRLAAPKPVEPLPQADESSEQNTFGGDAQNAGTAATE